MAVSAARVLQRVKLASCVRAKSVSSRFINPARCVCYCSALQEIDSLRFTSSMRSSEVKTPLYLSVRTYAKAAKKEKGKSKKGGGEKIGDIFKTITAEDLNELIDYDMMCAKMLKSVEHLQEQLADKVSVRTNPGAFDNIMVNTEDGRFKLMELGQIIQKNPQLIVVNLEAAPQYMKDVSNALVHSGLNVNPQQDGTSLFIPVPKVTREHREGLAKNARALGTQTKDSLRKIQNKYLKDLKSNCNVKDTLRHAEEAVNNTLKKYAADIDEIVEAKTKELLQ